MLRHTNIADYRWGGLVARFSSFAPVTRRSGITTLAEMSRQVGQWRTTLELRERMALCHEVAHYAQDLLTGVGHHDHLSRAETVPALLQATARASSLPVDDPEISNITARWKHFDSTQLVHWLEDAQRDEEEAIVNALSSLPMKANDVDHWASAFTCNYLFEGEAAAVAARYIVGADKLSSTQLQILNANRDLWMPSAMPPAYKETFSVFRNSLAAVIGDIDEEDAFNGMDLLFRLFIFFSDVAAAYPPPSLVPSSVDTALLLPGVKFSYLLSAFLHLDDAATLATLQDIVNGEFRAAEHRLLSVCQVSYPMSKRIYRAWAQLFAQQGESDDSRILRLRRRAADARVRMPRESASRTMMVFIDTQLPFVCLTTQSGVIVHYTGPVEMDIHEQQILLADLLALRCDFAIIDRLIETKAFICPLAEAKVCSVRIPACSDGIQLAHLPHDGCSVRTRLTH